jgi:hypothetical protein
MMNNSLNTSILTCAEGVKGAAVWRMPEGGNAPLERVAELRSGNSAPRAFAWHPSEADCGLSVHSSGLQQWKVADASAEVSLSLGCMAPGCSACLRSAVQEHA